VPYTIIETFLKGDNMKLLDKEFNSKYGVVKEQDRTHAKHVSKHGWIRSFEPIDGRDAPVVIVFDPEVSSLEYFYKQTGIDLR